MNIQNTLVEFSGTQFGTGSRTIGLCLLVVKSGTGVFVPVELNDLK